MFEKFPGLMYCEGAILMLHADWPMYPGGKGWKIALKSLGNYPINTRFYVIDDIDKCRLLLNKNPKGLSNPYNDDYYHVAIWHDDLIELHEKGFISGVYKSSDFECEVYEFNEIKEVLLSVSSIDARIDESGNIVIRYGKNDGSYENEVILKPDKEKFESEKLENFNEEPYYVFSKAISITDNGIKELAKIANEIEVCEELKELTDPIVDLGRYDTAIREAALLVESKIKRYHNCETLYGQKLLKYHIDEIIKSNDNFNSAAIKCYRGRLRTIFKFVRNDYAHNFKVISLEQCNLILKRIDDIINEFYEVIDAYFDEITAK